MSHPDQKKVSHQHVWLRVTRFKIRVILLCFMRKWPAHPNRNKLPIPPFNLPFYCSMKIEHYANVLPLEFMRLSHCMWTCLQTPYCSLEKWNVSTKITTQIKFTLSGKFNKSDEENNKTIWENDLKPEYNES